MRRLMYQVWWSLSRGLTLGVRGLVMNAPGEVLLVRHTYQPGWHFPGGGVERAETAEQALSRELIEEAGVSLVAPPLLLGVFSNHANHPNDHVLMFEATAWEPCRATSVGEIAEAAFFSPHSPPEGTTPGTRRRLCERFGAAPRSPHW